MVHMAVELGNQDKRSHWSNDSVSAGTIFDSSSKQLRDYDGKNLNSGKALVLTSQEIL